MAQKPQPLPVSGLQHLTRVPCSLPIQPAPRDFSAWASSPESTTRQRGWHERAWAVCSEHVLVFTCLGQDHLHEGPRPRMAMKSDPVPFGFFNFEQRREGLSLGGKRPGALGWEHISGQSGK